MTLRYRPLEVECDGCGHVVDADDAGAETHEELLDAIRKDGWELKKTGDGWQHLCCDCTG